MRGILTYHSIDSSGSPISIGEETFRRHVRWLAAGHLPVVGLEEIVRLPPEADAVALTFDDGFANFGSIAAPLLLEHGMPATLFVVTEHVGRDNAWMGNGFTSRRVPTLPLLGWDALARLSEAGVTLGAHSRTHPQLTTLSGAALNDEVEGSRMRMAERTGRSPTAFAYPYGDLNATVEAAVRAAFSLGCTTELRPLGTENAALRLPRIDVYYLRAPGLLEAWGSARFRYRLELRRHGRRVRQRWSARTSPA